MTSPRSQYLAAVKSVVIKLGSQLLTDKATRRLDPAFLATIAREVAQLRARDIEVTIVSSGAISAGLAELNLP